MPNRLFAALMDYNYFYVIHRVDRITWNKLPQDVVGMPVLYHEFAEGPQFWPKPEPGLKIFDCKELPNAK